MQQSRYEKNKLQVLTANKLSHKALNALGRFKVIRPTPSPLLFPLPLLFSTRTYS